MPVPLETKGQNLTQEILDLLDTKEPLQSNEDFPTISQAEIKAALDRLASRSMVTYKSLDSEKVLLTPESEGIVAEGSHEYKVWKLVKEKERVPIVELPVRTTRPKQQAYTIDNGHRKSSERKLRAWDRAMVSRTSG